MEDLEYYLTKFAGRPTPLYFAKNLTEFRWIKHIFKARRLHGGAHKINNTLGQALLAKRMGKKRVIAETGAGNTVVCLRLHVQHLTYSVKYSWAQKM